MESGNSTGSSLEQTLQDGRLYRQVNALIVAHLRDNNLNQVYGNKSVWSFLEFDFILVAVWLLINCLWKEHSGRRNCTCFSFVSLNGYLGFTVDIAIIVVEEP